MRWRPCANGRIWPLLHSSCVMHRVTTTRERQPSQVPEKGVLNLGVCRRPQVKAAVSMCCSVLCVHWYCRKSPPPRATGADGAAPVTRSERAEPAVTADFDRQRRITRHPGLGRLSDRPQGPGRPYGVQVCWRCCRVSRCAAIWLPDFDGVCCPLVCCVALANVKCNSCVDMCVWTRPCL